MYAFDGILPCQWGLKFQWNFIEVSWILPFLLVSEKINFLHFF
jgi:hypothetical protein